MKTLLAVLLLGASMTHAGADQPRRSIIPGLTAAEICDALTQRGFRLSTQPAKTQTMHALEDGDYTRNRSVNIYCPADSLDTPFVVSCLARTDDAKVFLGALAMLPIRGVNAEEASAWVKDNLGHQTARAWWGVKFQLYYNEKTDFHSLRISMDPLNDGDFPPTDANSAPAEPTPPPDPVAVAAPEPSPEPSAPTQPRIGQPFAEIVAAHGDPTIKDAATGWAWWKDFKVKFINSKAVQVTPKE